MNVRKRNVFGPVATAFGSTKTGSWRLSRPVVSQEECISCGTCATYCPGQIISVNKAHAVHVTIDLDYCKGCGICANECPKKIIKMIPEEEC